MINPIMHSSRSSNVGNEQLNKANWFNQETPGLVVANAMIKLVKQHLFPFAFQKTFNNYRNTRTYTCIRNMCCVFNSVAGNTYIHLYSVTCIL